jgi:hypothetical protein
MDWNHPRFQNRKLNRCDHCGTNKRIAAHFDINGRMYFLCAPATFILESMMRGIRDAQFGGVDDQGRFPKVSKAILP